MSSAFESWSERDIFIAKRSAEMETASVAHTNFTTSSRRSVPMHRDSSQISDLLNPVRGIRDAQRRCVNPTSRLAVSPRKLVTSQAPADKVMDQTLSWLAKLLPAEACLEHDLRAGCHLHSSPLCNAATLCVG